MLGVREFRNRAKRGP